MQNNLKFLLSLFIMVTLFSACSKNDDLAPGPVTPGVGNGITAPPATFTKKAILEYHTAAWCNTCPDAEV